MYATFTGNIKFLSLKAWLRRYFVANVFNVVWEKVRFFYVLL